MAIQHELQITWRGGGVSIPKTVRQSGDGEDNRDIDVPNSTVNMLVDHEIDISQLKMLFITATKAMTLKTNSSSSPQETVPFSADNPLFWYLGCGLEIPFAGDVTSLYVSNASGALGVLTIRQLEDATP